MKSYQAIGILFLGLFLYGPISWGGMGTYFV